MKNAVHGQSSVKLRLKHVSIISPLLMSPLSHYLKHANLYDYNVTQFVKAVVPLCSAFSTSNVAHH